MTTSASSSTILSKDPHNYPAFLKAIRKQFSTHRQQPLFITDAVDLWDLFLSHLPMEARQYYTCSTCRQFIKRFGGLVKITPEGKTHSAMWDSHAVPAFFQLAVRAMQRATEQAKVIGVFHSSACAYGVPQTGHWHHMAVVPHKSLIWDSPVCTANQHMAKKREAFTMLSRALNEFSADTVTVALKLLRSEALYRSEKVLGVAEWLGKLYKTLANTANLTQKSNQQWLAVATAPEGFCHVRSSMIGTLLEDIELGFEYQEIRQRFAEKMDPLQYQRPQTPPKAGNIQQAENIIAQLKAAGSLERRFARLDELTLLWRPTPQPKTVNAKLKQAASTGVFGHLLSKSSPATKDMTLPTQVMTWEKFARTVLPYALSVEFLVPRAKRVYTAITTAVDVAATAILQWDREGQRNPCSLYVYHGGSSPADWFLRTGYTQVTGICTDPAHWHQPLSHHQRRIILILSKARDRHYKRAGSAIFPENLKSEFHSIRKTIEAFSRDKPLGGFDESSACGVLIFAGEQNEHQVRVTSELGVQEYYLDRLD